MSKLAYYRNYRIDSNKILHCDKNQQTPFVSGPNMRISHKSKMADGHHLGNKKLIRRLDSERELFYDDIVYMEASAYAH